MFRDWDADDWVYFVMFFALPCFLALLGFVYLMARLVVKGC